VVAAKPISVNPNGLYMLASAETANGQATLLDEIRELTDAVFRGLDLEREIVAVATQRIGDTLCYRVVATGWTAWPSVTAGPEAKREATPATSRSRQFVLARARPTGSSDCSTHARGSQPPLL
jgi:hypothetical protein